MIRGRVDHDIRVAQALSGVLDQDSAARYHGWETKHPPTTPCVTVPRKRSAIGPGRRAGVSLSYRDVPPSDHNGVALSPGATVMSCAARMPFDEALAIADSALRHGDVKRPDLVGRARSMPHRYGARCLRVALAADGRAANPFESVLRAIAPTFRGSTSNPRSGSSRSADRTCSTASTGS